MYPYVPCRSRPNPLCHHLRHSNSSLVSGGPLPFPPPRLCPSARACPRDCPEYGGAPLPPLPTAFSVPALLPFRCRAGQLPLGLLLCFFNPSRQRAPLTTAPCALSVRKCKLAQCAAENSSPRWAACVGQRRLQKSVGYCASLAPTCTPTARLAKTSPPLRLPPRKPKRTSLPHSLMIAGVPQSKPL